MDLPKTPPSTTTPPPPASPTVPQRSFEKLSDTPNLRDFDQRLQERSNEFAKLKENKCFMDLLFVLFDMLHPAHIAGLLKYNGLTGRIGATSIDDLSHFMRSDTKEIAMTINRNSKYWVFFESPFGSSDFYLGCPEAKLLFDICNFGMSTDDNVEKVKALKRALFCSLPLDTARKETGGKLGLNDTVVVRLIKPAGAQYGMFVCAPLCDDGEDMLRNCYKKIFQTALQQRALSLAVSTFSTGEHGFGHDIAAQIAVEEACIFFDTHPTVRTYIYFVVYQNVSGIADTLNATAYQKAFNNLDNTKYPRLSCIKSQIEYWQADIVVIPVGLHFQNQGAVYHAIKNVCGQTKFHEAATTHILPGFDTNDTYPIFAGSLFDPVPENIHRHTYYLWNNLQESLKTTYLPNCEAQFQAILSIASLEVIGVDLIAITSADKVDDVDLDGIDVDFWRDDGIPALLKRFSDIHHPNIRLKTSQLHLAQADPNSLFGNLPLELVRLIQQNLIKISL